MHPVHMHTWIADMSSTAVYIQQAFQKMHLTAIAMRSSKMAFECTSASLDFCMQTEAQPMHSTATCEPLAKLEQPWSLHANRSSTSALDCALQLLVYHCSQPLPAATQQFVTMQKLHIWS